MKLKIKSEHKVYDAIYDILNDKEDMAECIRSSSEAIIKAFNNKEISYPCLLQIISASPHTMHAIKKPPEQLMYDLSKTVPYYVAWTITPRNMSDRILKEIVDDSGFVDFIFQNRKLLSNAIKISSPETLRMIVDAAYDYWDGIEVLDPFVKTNSIIEKAIGEHNAK